VSRAPEISVVIPTYNSAHSLPDAIGSVRAQRWPNLEILVVDDGSTDRTDRVLADLAGPDMHVIRQQNHGPAAARNSGIAAASGEWIAFLDADDLWLPGKLERQFDAIRCTPHVGFCYSDSLVQTTDGRTEKTKCRRPREATFLELLWGNMMSTATVLVRRDCFQVVGHFDPELRTGEDWDMWLRLATCFETVWVREPLALIRKSLKPRDSVTKLSCDSLERCVLRVLRRLFSSAEVRQRHPEVAVRRRRTLAWHYSVLAKSYLGRRLWSDYIRLTAFSVSSHPLGLCYTAPTRYLPQKWLPSLHV